MIKTNHFDEILQKLLETLTAIFAILNYITLEKRWIMGILEQITALYSNRDRYFGIYKLFISFLPV